MYHVYYTMFCTSLQHLSDLRCSLVLDANLFCRCLPFSCCCATSTEFGAASCSWSTQAATLTAASNGNLHRGASVLLWYVELHLNIWYHKLHTYKLTNWTDITRCFLCFFGWNNCFKVLHYSEGCSIFYSRPFSFFAQKMLLDTFCVYKKVSTKSKCISLL